MHGVIRKSLIAASVAVTTLTVALATAASAVNAQTVTVSAHDTVWTLAQRHHVDVATIVRVNHLPSGGRLVKAGQKLEVPGSSPPAAQTVSHRVVPGDTLFGLARRYGESEAQIAADNHLPAGGTVFLGTTLVLRARPAPAPPATAGAPPPRYPPAVVAAAQRDRATLAARPMPSTSAVRAMVVDTAHRLGVDPSLALAIADQESGFQQAVVSNADAIGVMQVLPVTAKQLSRLAGHTLDPLNAADNVTTGVLLLKLLTRAAPLDQAVAGYYQGLSSVQRLGPFADTERYVKNVLALRTAYASGRR